MGAVDYSVYPSKQGYDWIVESALPDGQVQRTIFSGPGDEKRAKEYVEMLQAVARGYPLYCL